MPDMTMEERISAIQDERDDAREDLRETLTEVNAKVTAKVEHVGEDLRPDRIVEHHSAGATLLAGAIGFLVGTSSENRATGPIMIAALVGYALSRRGTKDAK